LRKYQEKEKEKEKRRNVLIEGRGSMRGERRSGRICINVFTMLEYTYCTMLHDMNFYRYYK